MNSLVYVDKRLIVPIGAKLVGSSLQASRKASGTGGFNWFIAATLKLSEEAGVETRIADLFPEDILHYTYDKIENSLLEIRDLCTKITAGQLKSADVVSVVGKLLIPGVTVGSYDPFNPPEIKITETFKVYGEACFSARIETEGYQFPVFFLVESKEIVCYAKDKPVEVVGVLKWSPSYEVGGFSINQILLGAALLLRK